MTDLANEVRSYASVFALERRIYRVDRFRLNPGGVPLRGIAYFVSAAVACWVLRVAPVISWPFRVAPWYCIDVGLPFGVAALLATLRIEGRTFHVTAAAASRYGCMPRRLVGLEGRRRMARTWAPPRLIVIADGSGAAPRPLQYHGPGAVLITYAHDRVEWRWRRGSARARVSIYPLKGAHRPVSSALEVGADTVLMVHGKPASTVGSGRI